jgi:hypothetical protein
VIPNVMFVIVMEALGRMFSAAVSGGFLFGFSMMRDTNISHLLFADGTLLFYGADPNLLRHIWSIFLCFKVVSV